MEDMRRNWPFLRDRRIDSYAAITSRILDVPQAKDSTSSHPAEG